MIKILKFIIDDFKKDYDTFKAMCQGKAKLQFKPSELFTDWQDTFIKNWMFFLIIILALTTGWFIAGKYYQNQCNIHIMTTVYPDVLLSEYPNIAKKEGVTEDTKSICLERCDVLRQQEVEIDYYTNLTRNLFKTKG